ncbi:hypothetical protein [Actinocorallia aurantiaca]|uniref:HK97 gp10 family phage protein n=3 Tax=Actinocorallia TaxID=58108 RepID=A0ABN3UT49_9ACTN
MADPPVDVTVSTDGLDSLVRAIRAEEDGKDLRKELAKNLREALKPAAAAAKSGIRAMPADGSGRASPALRPTIAAKIRPEVKLGGRWTGARVKAFKTPTLRRFPNAPKRTQKATWRTRTFGRDEWREQKGKPGWFDDPMHADKAAYIRAVHEAMEAMAARLASRTRST